MDSHSILTAALIIILILLTGFAGAVEIAFSALNRIRMKTMAEDGSRRAKLALNIFENYNTLLSTTSIFANLCILSAASISTVFFIYHFDDVGAVISTIVVTILSLIFCDITPRSLARAFPDKFALFAAPIVRVLMIIFTPLNWIFSLWSKFIGLFVKTTQDEPTFTEEELLNIIDEAEHEGAIDQDDMELIHSAIEFNDLMTSEILTPRVKIVGVHKEITLDEMANIFIESGYSRIPVYDESLDDIIGIVHLRDFMELLIKKDREIADIATPANFVAPSMKISDLFKKLQRDQAHMVIVTDEYGGTAGLVTMEDILEELVGDIWDEADERVQEIFPLSDTEFKVLCSSNAAEMFEFFALPDEAESLTVGGWIMEKLERIPEVGDFFEHENLTVTVTRAEDKMAIECLVVKKEAAKDEVE